MCGEGDVCRLHNGEVGGADGKQGGEEKEKGPCREKGAEISEGVRAGHPLRQDQTPREADGGKVKGDSVTDEGEWGRERRRDGRRLPR